MPLLRTSFAYDAQGNATTETRAFELSPVGINVRDTRTVQRFYDAGGKVRGVAFPDRDAPGGGLTFTMPSLAFTLTYDKRGAPRSASVWRPAQGVVATMTHTRNVAGGLLLTDYDSAGLYAARARYRHDALGRAEDYEVTGGVSGMTLTPRARQQVVYSATDDVLKAHSQVLGTAPRVLNYDYDDRHQLVAVSDDQDFSAVYEYGSAGRFKAAHVATTGAPIAFPRTVEYEYARAGSGVIADPEAPIALLRQDGTARATYEYDHAGNLVRRRIGGMSAADPVDEYTFVYDGDQRQRAATNASRGTRQVDYYDSSGSRAIQVVKTGAATSQVRLWFGPLEIWYTPAGQPDKEWAHLSHGVPLARVPLRAALVAVPPPPISGPLTEQIDACVNGATPPYCGAPPDGELATLVEVNESTDFSSIAAEPTQIEFQFHNQLGHLLVSLNAETIPVGGFQYGPFGEVLAEVGAPDTHLRRFNGKEYDKTTGLSYYGFRHYDPLSMTWTQADPLFRFAPDLAYDQPRRMNLYSFSLNNPMRYLDPDGREGLGVTPGMSKAEAMRAVGDWINGNSVVNTVIDFIKPDGVDIAIMSVGAGADGPLPVGDVLAGGASLGRRLARPIARLGRRAGKGLFSRAMGKVRKLAKSRSARKAAKRGSGGRGKRAFRAVSKAEKDDIARNGFRNSPDGRSMEDKWFAETREGAETYVKDEMYPDATEIIEADVPGSVYDRSHKDPTIDGIPGGGFCVPCEDQSSITPLL